MQFRQVQFGAVAFVLAEAILWETRTEVAHNHVARDFSDHTGRGDAETEAIAVDNSRLRQREGENRKTVDQGMVRLQAQRADGRPHRFVGGPQDIDRIDLNRIDNSDSPRDLQVTHQVVINLLASFGQKLFRII